MKRKWFRLGVAPLILLLAGCAAKHIPVPPVPAPAKQNVFVLLPEDGGKASGIVVQNSAGTQDLSQPYQAVRVQRSDVAPSSPVTLDQAEVRRLFGAALDVLPTPEVRFTLYFYEGKDSLIPESEAQLQAIMQAILERHSTAISVTGHTDTTGNAQSNYQLGMKRAQTLAGVLITKGVAASDVFVESHGDADLLVKTPRGVAEQRNRRVEVVVR